jgi:hypothetical protein
MKEVKYRTIEEFPGYRFGSDGSIWTCMSGGRQNGRWRLRKTTQNHKKWKHRFCILKQVGGRKKVHQVGHWILLAFAGPRPVGCECLHGDGDPLNNDISNLRWGTHKDNAEDSKRHGTMVRGERVGLAKVTEELVIQMRLRSAAGEQDMVIAADVGLDATVVSRIVRGELWPHVGGPIRRTDGRSNGQNPYGRMVRICGCGLHCKGPGYFNHAKVCPLSKDTKVIDNGGWDQFAADATAKVCEAPF